MTVEELLQSDGGEEEKEESWDQIDRMIKQLRAIKFVAVKSKPPSIEPSK